jgi:hypothetical protein
VIRFSIEESTCHIMIRRVLKYRRRRCPQDIIHQTTGANQMNDLYTTDQPANKNRLTIVAVLPLTIWVAHFFYFRHFGFYEDDYALVSPAFGWSLTELRDHTVMVFLTCTQGRPLNFFLPQFFSFIATQLGGVHVAYLIAFSVGTVNAFLVYILLKKLNSEIIAVTATLTFCLFFRPYNAHLFNARISPANLADFPVDRKSLLPFGAMNPGIPDHSGIITHL